MGTIATEAASVFRDREAPGSSQPHEPVKAEIRDLFVTVEDEIVAVEDFASAGVKWSTGRVLVRSTGNVDIATALENGDTLNGVTLATGNHVFLPYQTNPAENGFWTVQASGAAVRATFADTAAELAYIGILVLSGTAGAGERWTLNLPAEDITVGTTALNFSRIGIEVSYAQEVLDARGDFATLEDRLDDMTDKIDAEEQAEAAIGRAALYGISDPVFARLFAQNSREADFSASYYRDGFSQLDGLYGLDGWTFARNSEGTAEPSGGTLQVFEADEPRITNRGLLVETAAKQALGYSADFNSWSKTNITISAAANDYAGVASKNVLATSSGSTSIHLDAAGIDGNAAPGCTAWCIVSKGTGATVANSYALINLTAGNTALAIFTVNYDSGELDVTSGDPACVSIKPMGSGWWLIAITPQTGISEGDALRFYTGFIGASASAGDYFRMSHAQVENEPLPSSRIIATAGAAVDREADNGSAAFSAAGDFTVCVMASLNASERESTLLSIDDGSSSNRITVARLSSGAVRVQTSRSGSTASVTFQGKEGERFMKVAVASLANSATVSVDGEPVGTISQARPLGLNRIRYGRSFDGAPLDGYVVRAVVADIGLNNQALRDMTRPDGVEALSSAPLAGNPLQGRFNPLTAGTPESEYGLSAITVYGELPCALLVCEMTGPSVTAIGKDGIQKFRDTLHLGRWADVDPLTGYTLAGDPSYRRIRWLNKSGRVMHVWTLDSGIPGEIYGVRTNGTKLVVNASDGASAETWIWNLDGDGFPTGAGTEFTAFSGSLKSARSMLIDGNILWVAAIDSPTNPQGCQGALQAYNLTTGALIDSYYGHFPNDVDRLPSGEIVWADEHLDRLRGVIQSTDTVRSIMAGLEICYDYEPAVSSISANILARATNDGSGLEAAAVEYRGINGLYAPNGVSVIAAGLYAIADTDNSRVIIARETDTWEPEVLAVVSLFNQPTKVRIIPGG